jgi:phage tail-like protein
MPLSRGPDPSPSFRFHVEIQGIEVARFSECSGLELEQDTFDYREGGLNSRVHRLPGRFKFTNLTLKKGIATDGQSLWSWVEETVKGPIKPHTVTVTLYDLTGGKPLRTWNFQDAYPVKWSVVALSADQNAIAIESLILAHQGMSFAQ